MATLTRVKSFLSSWQNLLALGTLIPLGAWIYSRVWMVNPAILGDEYLYSMNSRKAAPWDPSPAGDFSNYLFNFVYQGTNLCGQGFYSCAKVLNLLFFLGFIFTLFIVAVRFLPFWAAYAFMVSAGLSPISVYTSMFLPESMYMFFIGLLLVVVLKAISEFNLKNWALVGVAIGAASLVKPHAWLSAIAVGITLLVVGLGGREIGLKKTSLGFVGLIFGAMLTRVFLGISIAGPKALGFFGQYFGFSIIEQVVTGPADSGGSTVIVGSSPMSGVIQLFLPQLQVHVLVAAALLAISLVALILGIHEILKTRRLSQVTAFALFSFIWFASLLIEIVIFTGWVTGGGDDHTTRVLLRYYEFLYLVLPLAGLAIWVKGHGEKTNVFVRWGLFLTFSLLLTPAFTGFFATLTIQIADAPTLAGLVVNADVFNAAAVIGMIALLVFASFPRYTAWVYAALLPVTMIGTGWQIQDQYVNFRGTLSAADKAGQYIRDSFSQAQIEDTWIIASSRFDATNVAIWADEMLEYGLFQPSSVVPANEVPEYVEYVVTTNDIRLDTGFAEEKVGEGFIIYKRSN
jgi:phosphoglycerol transferase